VPGGLEKLWQRFVDPVFRYRILLERSRDPLDRLVPELPLPHKSRQFILSLQHKYSALFLVDEEKVDALVIGTLYRNGLVCVDFRQL
jgi:hypothetical protein